MEKASCETGEMAGSSIPVLHSFHHEGMLDFPKSLFCIGCDDCVTSALGSISIIIILSNSHLLAHPGILLTID